MTAAPMTLEMALDHEGFTIDAAEVAEFTITTTQGTIVVPAGVRSILTWRREGDPELGDDLYLSSLPMFDEAYRPVLLSSVLDQFRTRRLAYNTPGQWRLAFRRWGNLNMRAYNLRYASTAVAVPLDDVAVSRHDLVVGSDFPQSLIADDADYATNANDVRGVENGRRRSIASLLEEQRTTFLNVDAEVIEAMGSLFLGVFDRGELGRPDYSPPPAGLRGFYAPGAGYGW